MDPLASSRSMQIYRLLDLSALVYDIGPLAIFLSAFTCNAWVLQYTKLEKNFGGFQPFLKKSFALTFTVIVNKILDLNLLSENRSEFSFTFDLCLLFPSVWRISWHVGQGVLTTQTEEIKLSCLLTYTSSVESQW